MFLLTPSTILEGDRSSLSFRVSQLALVVKNLPAHARNASSIPGLGRSPGGGHGNPLQCSRLKNPMDRGAWQASVHRVARAKQLSPHTVSPLLSYGL